MYCPVPEPVAGAPVGEVVTHKVAGASWCAAELKRAQAVDTKWNTAQLSGDSCTIAAVNDPAIGEIVASTTGCNTAHGSTDEIDVAAPLTTTSPSCQQNPNSGCWKRQTKATCDQLTAANSNNPTLKLATGALANPLPPAGCGAWQDAKCGKRVMSSEPQISLESFPKTMATDTSPVGSYPDNAVCFTVAAPYPNVGTKPIDATFKALMEKKLAAKPVIMGSASKPAAAAFSAIVVAATVAML